MRDRHCYKLSIRHIIDQSIKLRSQHHNTQTNLNLLIVDAIRSD